MKVKRLPEDSNLDLPEFIKACYELQRKRLGNDDDHVEFLFGSRKAADEFKAQYEKALIRYYREKKIVL
jgi:hypothetical protein